jgi:hypothetical protein
MAEPLTEDELRNCEEFMDMNSPFFKARVGPKIVGGLLATISALRAERDRLREYVETEAGFDCDTHDKYLNVSNSGCRCSSCRARAALRTGGE